MVFLVIVLIYYLGKFYLIFKFFTSILDIFTKNVDQVDFSNRSKLFYNLYL